MVDGDGGSLVDPLRFFLPVLLHQAAVAEITHTHPYKLVCRCDKNIYYLHFVIKFSN